MGSVVVGGGFIAIQSNLSPHTPSLRPQAQPEVLDSWPLCLGSRKVANVLVNFLFLPNPPCLHPDVRIERRHLSRREQEEWIGAVLTIASRAPALVPQ
jgi:hypothetical protein